MTVLHAAEIHLGLSISDAKIKKGKLTKLLRKEDFDVPAQVSILRCYLLDLPTVSKFFFIDVNFFLFLALTNDIITLFGPLEGSDIIIL